MDSIVFADDIKHHCGRVFAVTTGSPSTTSFSHPGAPASTKAITVSRAVTVPAVNTGKLAWMLYWINVQFGC